MNDPPVTSESITSYNDQQQQKKWNGPRLVKASNNYHDPKNMWNRTAFNLKLLEKRPGSTDRTTHLTIDLGAGFFSLDQQRGEHRIFRKLDGLGCYHKLDGKSEFTEGDQRLYRLDCPMTTRLRNYYTYLWGLPMKLADPGTVIHDEVFLTDYNGFELLQVKVTYEPETGGDTWYFYFDPQTTALRGYRFYHNEAINDGEFILLEDEIQINGVRFPKIRKWYTNDNGEYLAEDSLIEQRK